MSSAKVRSTFKKDWLTDEHFIPWLEPVQNNIHQARCALCKKSFELSNMGRRAVTSHGKSAVHQQRSGSATDNQRMVSFVRKLPTAVVVTAIASDQSLPLDEGNSCIPSTSTAISQVDAVISETGVISAGVDVHDKPSTLNPYFCNDSVSKSEIVWALKIIMGHLSYRSCLDLGETFQTMFPDSQIAKKFCMSKTKAAYSIVHGLAPYFKNKLDEDIKKCPVFVACFDEALNKIAQRGQMDIVIRYWSKESGGVATRYLSSAFLGHATAADLEIKFKEGLGDLSTQKLIQVSMDGPSVNWKFLESLQSNIHPDAADPKLLDLGSCGLHVIHGAFQTGM
jgi:hypothetical protein